jgi:hypothetical protein
MNAYLDYVDRHPEARHWYIWRRDDPDRAAKIATEYALAARQQRAAAASAAVRRMNVAPGLPLVPHPGATLPKGSPPR